MGHPAGAKEAAEKLQIGGSGCRGRIAGAEARVDFAVCGTTEVVPCYKAPTDLIFSAACEVGP